jgi:CheY-like chemotaxis protein
MNIFILEDDPNRIDFFRDACLQGGHTLTLATSFEEAKRLFDPDPEYNLVCLDHDLGGEQMVDSTQENTGSNFARWLAANHPNILTLCVIHSYNSGGAANMYRTLADAGWKRAICIPFGPKVLNYIASSEPEKGNRS